MTVRPPNNAPASLGVDEDTFLGVLTKALTDRGEPVAPVDTESARRSAADGSLVEAFIERATAGGLKVERCADDKQAAEHVLAVLRACDARSVLVPPEPIPARQEIAAAITGAGIQLADAGEADVAFEADVGITSVRLAVAETGSLALDSGPVYHRLASLAVPVHVAVLREGQIVADILDWAAAVRENPPAGTVLVSGPSKTADIELNLVTGVHGPGEVHVVMLPGPT